ncbi:unnamed protein product [Brassica rapa subsp. trilocularis]
MVPRPTTPVPSSSGLRLPRSFSKSSSKSRTSLSLGYSALLFLSFSIIYCASDALKLSIENNMYLGVRLSFIQLRHVSHENQKRWLEVLQQ